MLPSRLLLRSGLSCLRLPRSGPLAHIKTGLSSRPRPRPGPRRTQCVQFSSASPRCDVGSEVLAAKLKSELESETGSEEGSPGDPFTERLQKMSFDVIDQPDRTKVTFIRDFRDEQVSFSIVDISTPTNSLEDIDDRVAAASFRHGFHQGQASVDGDTVVEDNIQDIGLFTFPCRVQIQIQKDSEDGILTVDAYAEGGKFLINSIPWMPTPNSDHCYGSPPFSRLSKDLQLEFHRFLDERDISTELALLIPEYVDWKERKEYIRWLGRLEEFVDSQE